MTKAMSKTVLILLLILLGTHDLCGQTQHECPLHKIDVKDFFDLDTVSIIINNDTIISKYIVTSEPDIGLTQLRIKVAISNNTCLYLFGKDTINSHTIFEKSTVEITVIINSNLTVRSVDLCKGGYIGFSKIDTNTAHFYQSKRPFEYE